MKNTLIPFVSVMSVIMLACAFLCDVRPGWSLPDWQVRAICVAGILALWSWTTWVELQDLRKFRQDATSAKAAARRALRVRCRVALLANPKRA